MRSCQYGANFTPDRDGGFVVRIPDVPEVVTQGETVQQCIEQAIDALDEAITGRINTGEVIPNPSGIAAGQYAIPVPPQTALKAALYDEIRSQGRTKVQIAAMLGIDEKEVRRLLDPHHPSKLTRISEILGRNGKRVVLSIEDDHDLLSPRV